jgi:hypothetical protein
MGFKSGTPPSRHPLGDLPRYSRSIDRAPKGSTPVTTRLAAQLAQLSPDEKTKLARVVVPVLKNLALEQNSASAQGGDSLGNLLIDKPRQSSYNPFQKQ